MFSRTPMKKTQFGSRDLLANGGSCPVEVEHKDPSTPVFVLALCDLGLLSFATTER